MTSRPEPGEGIAVDDAVGDLAAGQPAVLVADERLLAAHDLARAALVEITPEVTIGDPVGYRLEADGVVSLRFANRLAGYPGWLWTVSLARVDDADPTVLEVELLPDEGALLAPEWIPWAVRLADYHAQQLAAAETSALADVDAEEFDDDLDDLDDDLDDVVDLDAADFDGDGSPILHAGDVDGVDIDELADDDELDDDELGGDALNGNALEDDALDDDALDDDEVDDEEDDMTDSPMPDRDPISDDEFVSDEDDLGEDELEDDDQR